jgi:hypothetical protein
MFINSQGELQHWHSMTSEEVENVQKNLQTTLLDHLRLNNTNVHQSTLKEKICIGIMSAG